MVSTRIVPPVWRTMQVAGAGEKPGPLVIQAIRNPWPWLIRWRRVLWP